MANTIGDVLKALSTLEKATMNNPLSIQAHTSVKSLVNRLKDWELQWQDLQTLEQRKALKINSQQQTIIKTPPSTSIYFIS